MADATPTKEETAEEKRKLIQIIQPELREHGLVDLTDFINKNSSEGFRHEGFVRSVAYLMEERGIAEVIPQKDWNEFYVKRTIWSRRHPYWNAAKLAAIGVVFSIIAGISIAFTQSVMKESKNEFPNTKNLYDSVVNIQREMKVMKDSLTSIRKRQLKGK
jgi:hypothetical protein